MKEPASRINLRWVLDIQFDVRYLVEVSILPNLLAMKNISIDESVTRSILEHHFQTFQHNDIDGIMMDYTEESILITPTSTYKGLSEIRENFVRIFESMPANGTIITLTRSEITRDIAYVVWKAVTPTLEFKYATDTFVIVNSKIVSQTFAGDVVPLEMH